MITAGKAGTMMVHEIEAKFECTSGDVDRLHALNELAGFDLQSEFERTQDDLYFDSEDGVLRAGSASLRLRRIGDDTLLATYKGSREMLDAGSDAQIVKRQEIEHPVSLPAGVEQSGELSPGLLAGTPALQEAESAFGSIDLVPVARLQTRRRVRRFGHDDEPLLELALDQVVGTRISDSRQVEFVEVELESLSGDVTTLQAAVTTLLDTSPGLQSSKRTKLGRTLD